VRRWTAAQLRRGANIHARRGEQHTNTPHTRHAPPPHRSPHRPACAQACGDSPLLSSTAERSTSSQPRDAAGTPRCVWPARGAGGTARMLELHAQLRADAARRLASWHRRLRRRRSAASAASVPSYGPAMTFRSSRPGTAQRVAPTIASSRPSPSQARRVHGRSALLVARDAAKSLGPHRTLRDIVHKRRSADAGHMTVE
jgi:hypothetical protein